MTSQIAQPILLDFYFDALPDTSESPHEIVVQFFE